MSIPHSAPSFFKPWPVSKLEDHPVDVKAMEGDGLEALEVDDPPFAPTLDKGLIQNPCQPPIWAAWNFGTGSPFWTLTPPLPSLYLLISVSSNDLMD